MMTLLTLGLFSTWAFRTLSIGITWELVRTQILSFCLRPAGAEIQGGAQMSVF